MAICEDKHVVNISCVQEQNSNDLNSSKLRNVDQMIIDSFWKLIEIKRDIRLKAAENILNSLQKPKKGDTSSNVSYCLQRLIKGLASSRKAARQGYALLLTELLRSYSTITIDDVLDLIKKNLSLTGDKADKRANAIGQVLAYAAIIHSGKFRDELEKINEIVNSLRILQSEKSNLQLAIYKLFINIFNQIDSDCFKQYIRPHLKQDLKIGWENCTPDILWMLIVCNQLFPEILNSKFLMKHWNMEHIFQKENFIHLARIIKDSTSVHPSIHPVCHIIVDNASKLKLKDFKEFWKIVEENLFIPGQHAKEFLGFELVKIILPKLKKTSLVETVLLDNFSNILIKSSTTSQSSLNISAFEMCEFLVKFVSECKKSDIQVVVLKMFLKEPGAILFDRFTKRKTLSNIIQNLKSEAVKSFVELLKSIFLTNKNENEDVIVNDQTRTFALYQISVLVGHHTMVSDVCWKKECVQFLFLHSFFKIKELCTEVPESLTVPMDMSNSLKETCRTSFIRSLECLLKSSSVSSKTSQIQEKYEMMFSLLHYANNILNLPNNFIPLIDFNEIKESWEMVIEMVTKLQKQQKKDGKLQESCAFQILFIYLGFQLFIDPSEILDILQELKECCTHALKKRKHQANKLNDSKTDEPNWIDMIIDLILSLLSHPSHLTRRIVMTVFPLFCPFMTENSLQLILDAVNPQKSSDENNSSKKNNEETEDENEELSFESETSDEEEMDIDEADDSKINDLRNSLQAVLGNEEDSEHYLSDSEMFKLDDAIAQAFASQKKPSKKMTNLEETELIHFRMRCIDLLCSFLKSEPPLNQVIFLILPLINAMEYGYHHKNQATFAMKIETLLTLLIKYRKNVDNVNQTELSEILKKLMEKAKKATDFQVHKCLNQLCIYIVRCSRKMTQTNSLNSETTISKEWYIEDYKELLRHYLESSSTHILPDMFTSMIESCPETAWDFADDISKSAFSPDIRLYKKTQILTMLQTVLNCTKNLPVLTKKIWKKFYKKLLPNVLKAFKDITTTKEMKPTYTVELIKVILTTEEINSKFEMSIKNFEEFNELKDITSKQEQKLPKKTRAVWRKLAKLLSINES